MPERLFPPLRSLTPSQLMATATVLVSEVPAGAADATGAKAQASSIIVSNIDIFAFVLLFVFSPSVSDPVPILDRKPLHLAGRKGC